MTIHLKKAQELLYFLLVKKTASRSELIGLLWADEDDKLAHRHLRDNLYRLKKELPLELVTIKGKSTLQLNPAVEFRIDVDELLNNKNIDVYEGEFLASFSGSGSIEYEDWTEKMRTTFRDVFLSQLDKLANESMQAGRTEDAEKYWRRYLQEEPLSEPVSICLMKLYQSCGDYNRAALIYRNLHKALSDWLGITPLKETSEMYYAIMREWNERAEADDGSGDDFIIGRQEQLQSLTHMFSQGGSVRHRQSFAILGEAGVGKTHLLSYFLAHENIVNYEIITTSCFKSKKEEYLYPWHTIMISIASYVEQEQIRIPSVYRRAVNTLFPVFGQKSSAGMEKKAHLLIDSVMSFDNVLMTLSFAASKRPLLLVLEDIQWCDKVSISLLDQVIHKIDSGKIIFAATCRHPAEEYVSAFLSRAEDDGLCCRYELAPFTQDETMQFIAHSGAESMPQEDKNQIYQDTQGNAFLLTQLIRSIMERGKPKVLPHNMKEILSYRLSGLSPEGQQVLDLVAMFPDYAPYKVLERISSKSALDLLYVCQELCRRSILAEVYDGGDFSLVFTQAEFRDLTYSRIHFLSRRILHLNIAKALSELTPSTAPNMDALIAFHYEQGGDELHALQYKVRRFKTYVFFNYALLNGTPRNGEILLDSTPKAMVLFHQMERELQKQQKLHPDDKMLDEVRIDLYYSMGCFCIYRGLYEEGTNAILQLLNNPETPQEMLDLAHEQMTFYGIQTYRTDIMREHIEAALQLTKDRDRARYAINRRYNGYLLVMEDHFEEGREELLRTLMLLSDGIEDEIDRTLQCAYAHDYIGEAYRKQGLYKQALEEYKIAVAMLGDYIISTSKPMFLVDWAMTALAMGDYESSRRILQQADIAAGEIKEPSGYFQTLFCAFGALFAFADGDDKGCVNLLSQCEQLTSTLIVPYDTGILNMVKAIVRFSCDRRSTPNKVIDGYLTESYRVYCKKSRHALKNKSGVFESKVLTELEEGKLDSFSTLFK